ncbi:hypothetical protein GCM10020295_51330 [Streptomyces cinereospinus]
MKLSVRLAAVAAAPATAACAPQASGTSSSGKDEQTGTLRVRLSQEVDDEPEERVVRAVADGFEKAREGTEVTADHLPVESRARRIKAAFNDPASAPDVIAYGGGCCAHRGRSRASLRRHGAAVVAGGRRGGGPADRGGGRLPAVLDGAERLRTGRGDRFGDPRPWTLAPSPHSFRRVFDNRNSAGTPSTVRSSPAPS